MATARAAIAARAAKQSFFNTQGGPTMARTSVIVLLLIGLIGATAGAGPRVVVAEHFTQWNCGYCPDANTALDVLLQKYPANLAAVRYHGWWPSTNNDPFYLADSVECKARINYYSVASYGVPAHVVDGDTADFQVDETRITQALARTSPIDLSMVVTYDTLTRTGNITWTAKATAAVPTGSLRLRIVITETNVYYASAGTNGEHTFNQAVRDMVTDATGTSITLVNPGDSVTQTVGYTLGGTWNADNCEIVAFVQSDAIARNSPSIYQGTKNSLSASLVQRARNLSENGGNGNGYFDPGENANLAVTVQNVGGAGTGAAVTLACADPYITLGTTTWDIGAMAFGDSLDNSGAPFTLTVNSDAPIGHRVNLIVTKHIVSALTAHAFDKVDTVWFLVGTPTQLFADDFEAGYSQWTRGGSGGSVNWDTPSAQYHSASRCLTDSRVGNYANSVNRYSQMTAGVNLQTYTGATVSWWERFEAEGGWGVCKAEYYINGGRPRVGLCSHDDGRAGAEGEKRAGGGGGWVGGDG
ncbi:Omp28-related outer membrane protein, partial [bacterium]|nr:Omp28-related outer membrane protein [bacterium]